jgi:hypothetical protein
MKTETVIRFFGTKTAVARALGISQVAVTRWGLLFLKSELRDLSM